MRISQESVRHLHEHRPSVCSWPVSSDPLLVRLGGGNKGRPLFLVHAVGGGVGCYLQLVRLLDAPFPVYGLRHPGTIVNHVGETWSLPALASRYLAAVRGVCGRGPYRFGGWSLGGVIAYLMAQKAEATADASSLVLIVDTPPPDAAGRFRFNAPDFDTESEFAHRGIEEAFAELAAVDRDDRLEETMRRKLQDTYRLNTEAMFACEISPAVHHIRFVAARHSVLARDHSEAWKRFACERFESLTCEGTHHGIMREPEVGALAAAWRDWLEDAVSTVTATL